MIFSKDTICELCKEKVPTLGLYSHIKKHGMDYEEYKEKYIYKYEPCLTCGKSVKLPQKCCSIKCANSQRNYVRTVYNLSEIQEKEIVDLYSGGASLEEVHNKLGCGIETMKRVLKKYSIKMHTAKDGVAKNNTNRALNFLNSDLGRQLITEYTSFGVSLKSLEKKYKITKQTLKKIFILRGIKIKPAIESQKEVFAHQRSLGIRHPNYRKPPAVGAGTCHWYFYEGIKYQGSWEFKVGLWLKKNNSPFLCHVGVRQFEYELNGIMYTYCPDFYIPNKNYFIEVKGYSSDFCKEKMEVIKKIYPEVRIEMYDKKVLKEKGIFSIDKELGICIENFMLDYKSNDFFINTLKKSVSEYDLAKQNIVEGKTLLILAKQYNVPYLVMLRYFRSYVPQQGTDEFTAYLYENFYTEEHKQIVCNSLTIIDAVRKIENGLSFKRNWKIISQIKKGQLLEIYTKAV